MGFDDFVAVFICSVKPGSMSKMFGFSPVFICWVIILDCSAGFNKLEALLGCLTATEFMSLLFDAL